MLRARRPYHPMLDHVATAMRPPGQRSEYRRASVCSGSMDMANETNMCVYDDFGRIWVKSVSMEVLAVEQPPELL
jgi:hypothetical protein